MENDPPDKLDETDCKTYVVSDTNSRKTNIDNAINNDNKRTGSANATANGCGILLKPNIPPSNDYIDSISEVQESGDQAGHNRKANGRPIGFKELKDYLVILSNHSFMPKGDVISRSHDCRSDENIEECVNENTDWTKYKQLCEQRWRAPCRPN